MSTFDPKVTREYLKRAQNANTEAARKELFLQLATRLFKEDNDAQAVLSDLAKGAEHTIIARTGIGAVGRADTYHENIIIEWKASLSGRGAEHKTYWATFISASEANYVSAFLNSDCINQAIKQFQSRGLFGERDIHTTPLKVPYPRYDKGNSTHRQISELTQTLSDNVLEQTDLYAEAHKNSHALGRARSAIRDFFSDEFAAINEPVREQVDSATTNISNT